MRFYSFLFVSILFVSVCDAYTVVLLSGKQLHGKLVAEDSSTIHFHDSSGVFLSIKKAIVDLDATLKANTKVRQSQTPIVPDDPTQPQQKSVVDVARELHATRTGNSRVYTKEDLNRVPEVSVGNDPEYDSETASEVPKDKNLDESYWRKAAADLRKELTGWRERKISAEFSCAKAREKRSSQIYGGNRRPSDLSQAFEKPPECKRFDEVQSQLNEAVLRWDEFTERARKSGVPWAWIE